MGRDQRLTDATKLGGVKFGEIDGNGRLPHPSGVVRNHCRPELEVQWIELVSRKLPLDRGQQWSATTIRNGLPAAPQCLAREYHQYLA